SPPSCSPRTLATSRARRSSSTVASPSTPTSGGRGPPSEHAADRRLRPLVRLPLGRPRELGGLGRLAVLPPVRRAIGVRSHPRRAGRALVDPPRGRVHQRPLLPRGHHG